MGLLGGVLKKATKGLSGGSSGSSQSNPPASAKSTGIAGQFVQRMLKKTGVNGTATHLDSSAAMTE